jgi:hypothetical protein
MFQIQGLEGNRALWSTEKQNPGGSLGTLLSAAYKTQKKSYFKLLNIIHSDLIYFYLKITGFHFSQ